MSHVHPMIVVHARQSVCLSVSLSGCVMYCAAVYIATVRIPGLSVDWLEMSEQASVLWY